MSTGISFVRNLKSISRSPGMVFRVRSMVLEGLSKTLSVGFLSNIYAKSGTYPGTHNGKEHIGVAYKRVPLGRFYRAVENELKIDLRREEANFIKNLLREYFPVSMQGQFVKPTDYDEAYERVKESASGKMAPRNRREWMQRSLGEIDLSNDPVMQMRFARIFGVLNSLLAPKK